MLDDKKIMKRKADIDKIINKSKNEFELINLLRTKCDRIDLMGNNIVLSFDKIDFVINRKKRKIKEISTYDFHLKKFKKILF